MSSTASNHRMHTNRRPAFQFRCSGFFGRWIHCQRPFTAAVGDPLRSPAECRSLRHDQASVRTSPDERAIAPAAVTRLRRRFRCYRRLGVDDSRQPIDRRDNGMRRYRSPDGGVADRTAVKMRVSELMANQALEPTETSSCRRRIIKGASRVVSCLRGSAHRSAIWSL
jgi:hypothetical protein